MGRSEGLAQGAGVELGDGLVTQVRQPVVPLDIGCTGLRQALLDRGRIGDQGYLQAVDDGRVLLLEVGVEQGSQVLQPEALLIGCLADAHPVLVALAHVPDALAVVHEVVDTALQHRLEVALELATVYLELDAHRVGAAILHLVEVGADDVDLAVGDVVRLGHLYKLEGR